MNSWREYLRGQLLLMATKMVATATPRVPCSCAQSIWTSCQAFTTFIWEVGGRGSGILFFFFFLGGWVGGGGGGGDGIPYTLIQTFDGLVSVYGIPPKKEFHSRNLQHPNNTACGFYLPPPPPPQKKKKKHDEGCLFVAVPGSMWFTIAIIVWTL